ncbi:Isochorismate synthase DhbC [Paenibacillus sp. JJ-223]|nr:Isochorismate synthase DhbC [Paenibacillus sp. JJ-223]
MVLETKSKEMMRMSKASAVAATSALRLLEQYEEGKSFFWSSPLHTMLAQGEWKRLSDAPSSSIGGNALDTDEQPNPGLRYDEPIQGLLHRIQGLLNEAKQAGGVNPVAVGAIPFNPRRADVELYVPESVQWAEPPADSDRMRERLPAAGNCSIEEEPAAAVYEQSVRSVLTRLNAGELSKIVLARTLCVTSETQVDTHQLLRNLFRDNAHGYTFAVPMRKSQLPKSIVTTDNRVISVGEKGKPRTFLGASPELLVTRTGTRVRVNPLAGSAARSGDPEEDRRRAEALLASAKDRHEHAVVIDAVAAALRPLCKELTVPEEPSLIQTSTMWHLSTDIYGELADAATTSLELAFVLHPTPAICGTPVEDARDEIQAQEPFDRGLFTGMVGWCDSRGDGEWAVAIRCAEVQGHQLRLYAGAGIVPGSTPEAELAETAAKFGTMLRAMGLQSAGATREE